MKAERKFSIKTKVTDEITDIISDGQEFRFKVDRKQKRKNVKT